MFGSFSEGGCLGQLMRLGASVPASFILILVSVYVGWPLYPLSTRGGDVGVDGVCLVLPWLWAYVVGLAVGLWQVRGLGAAAKAQGLERSLA